MMAIFVLSITMKQTTQQKNNFYENLSNIYEILINILNPKTNLNSNSCSSEKMLIVP